MIKRALSWTGVVALAGAAALAGYWLLFTTFMVYDDEGYVLLSLRNFSLHGALYDQVYTQYGPFPYLLYDALHRLLGFEFTNTTGRLITLVNWLGTAAVCAVLVGRQTRSALWSMFTLAGVFTYLWVMINEPVHPGGLIALLVAVGVLLGAEAWQAGRPERFAMLTALIGVALALTKINVGVFFLGASFLWLALNTAPARVARNLTWLAAIGCAALPVLLMSHLWSEDWVRIFALVFAGGTLGLLLACRQVAQPVVGFRAWGWFAGAGAIMTIFVAGLILMRGTTPGGLLHGVLLEPLRHPGVYNFAMNWRIGTTVLAVGLLALAAWATRSGWTARPAFRQAVAAGRLVAGACFLASPLTLISTSLAAWGMTYGITVAWLFVQPVREDDDHGAVRGWVALALVFQFLHAYPVSGSQMNWGTYLFVPLLALGLHDAGPVYADWLGRRWRLLRPAAAGLILTVSLVMVQKLWAIGQGRFESNDPRLELPGAEGIRLPADTVTALHVLNENLQAHAGMVFSLPGTYSVNLWTGHPTPTLANATHWFSLLNEEQQQAIIRQLDADPRAAVVLQKDVLDYLVATKFPVEGPLHAWIKANFASVLAVDGYDLWLRRGRTIAPLSTARLQASGDNFVLTLTMVRPDEPVAAVEVRQMFAPNGPALRLDPAGAKFTLEPIDLDGRAIGPQRAGLPDPATGAIVRLMVEFPRSRLQVSSVNAALIVPVSAAGRALKEIRLVP